MNGEAPKSDQLANLMTYTVFHIGVYISLGAAVIAGGAIKSIDHVSLRISLACMLVAGACGGVIASCIPEYDSWGVFKEAKIGPWSPELWLIGRLRFKYIGWATVEHLVFWAGVLYPALTYLIKGSKGFGGG